MSSHDVTSRKIIPPLSLLKLLQNKRGIKWHWFASLIVKNRTLSSRPKDTDENYGPGQGIYLTELKVIPLKFEN